LFPVWQWAARRAPDQQDRAQKYKINLYYDGPIHFFGGNCLCHAGHDDQRGSRSTETFPNTSCRAAGVRRLQQLLLEAEPTLTGQDFSRLSARGCSLDAFGDRAGARPGYLRRRGVRRPPTAPIARSVELSLVGVLTSTGTHWVKVGRTLIPVAAHTTEPTPTQWR